MAEGLVRELGDPSVSALSATANPADPHPLACEVMRDVGVELSELTLRTPMDVEVRSFELVVTLGTFDPSYHFNLAGMPPHFHWDLPGIPREEGRDAQLAGYRAVRDQLRAKIDELLATGTLSGLQIARQNMELVLDSLADGVMAHTVNRRIFYFNTAAEKLTGFKREEVLGRDCHRVFHPKRFCGGDCSFCNGAVGQEERVIPKRAQVPFRQPSGEELLLDMTIMPLMEAQKTDVGALVSFKDNTEFARLKRRVHHSETCGKLIGKDPKTLVLFEQIREVGPVNVPVLIEGDSRRRGASSWPTAGASFSTRWLSCRPRCRSSC
jgi:PAS domain S-box-containing protein